LRKNLLDELGKIYLSVAKQSIAFRW